MTNNESNEIFLIDKNEENIIFIRSIFCCISFTCCFGLIIVYIILCFQIKLKLCIKKEEEDNNSDLSPFLENEFSSEESKKKKINKDGKIGLGSNFMFILTISNFFGAFFEFLFYFYYKNKKNGYNLSKDDGQINLYAEFNNDDKCHLFGFAHNFFDLYTVCWISMLTLLFYRSTNLSNEMQYQDKKYLIIGFLYSTILCIIFCVIPYKTDSYGFANYYCSFKYKDVDEGTIKKEKTLDKAWRLSFVAITFLNNAFNALCLIKTTLFYSKKLVMIQKQNKNEYKLMRIYVWVFRIFPIVLLVSRVFKGLSRLLIDEIEPGRTAEDIIEYANAFFFASNGIFDSIACLFFFKGVFWCCCPDTLSRNISSDKGSDMDYLGSDIIDD